MSGAGVIAPCVSMPFLTRKTFGMSPEIYALFQRQGKGLESVL